MEWTFSAERIYNPIDLMCHVEATNLQPKRKKGVTPVSGGVEKVGRELIDVMMRS